MAQLKYQNEVGSQLKLRLRWQKVIFYILLPQFICISIGWATPGIWKSGVPQLQEGSVSYTNLEAIYNKAENKNWKF